MVFGVVFAFGISPTAGAELSFTAFPRVFAEIAGGEGGVCVLEQRDRVLDELGGALVGRARGLVRGVGSVDRW